MARKELSERQNSMLRYIAQYIQDHTRPPTIREIGSKCSISSTSVVNYNLTRLVDKGLLERDAEVSRGLSLTSKAYRHLGLNPAMATGSMSIPFRGRIVAGEPLESFEEDAEEEIEIGVGMLPSNVDDLFALRVSGDSMIDAMVSDGDLVILRHQNTAKNGDMVAAWITGDDTTTLKYFYNEGSRIRLEPANPNPIYKSIFVEPERVQVQGKVEMVIRKL